MTTDPKLCQHLRAPNDPSGNPRRLFVIYSGTGDVLDVIDEGYAGAPRWVRALDALPTFTITATEYREWLKMAAKTPATTA